MKPHLVIVGLGNPGVQYERTRHNAGFRSLKALAAVYGTGGWKDAPKFQSRVQEGRIVTVPILLVEPQTFMNRSGECIRKIVDFYKLNPAQQLLVICDDIDLPLGEVRLRMKGGPGTHNGLRSIVETIGEEFSRLRIGLGDHPLGEELAAWVLSVPPPEDANAIEDAVAMIPEAVMKFVMEGNQGDQ